MADELKTFLVLFKDGHKLTVRAHSFNAQNYTFMKSAGQVDPDIYVRPADLLAVVPDTTPVAPPAGSLKTW